jgi:uncharacterized SAM-binding protein YcdF (DUF218 family)
MQDEPTKEDRRHGQALWDFHRLDDTLEPSDFILVLGSHDERVAEHAAGVFHARMAPLLVTTGGHGKITNGLWQVPEGERFARVAERCGVPPQAIVVENSSANTGENIANARRLLAERGLAPANGILVTKPYSRRPLAAARKQWPEIRWLVSIPDIAFCDYAGRDVPLRRTIELMVGDLQRIELYAELGFQVAQDVPAEVRRSYDFLCRAGYDRFVLPPRSHPTNE